MHHPLRRLTSHLMCVAFAALALLPGAANAQATQRAPERPTCIPMVTGYPVHLPRVVEGEAGTHIFVACSPMFGAPVVWGGFSCPPSVCSEYVFWAAIWQITRAAPERKESLSGEIWDRHVKYRCRDVLTERSARGAMCRERAAIFAANRADWSR